MTHDTLKKSLFAPFKAILFYRGLDNSGFYVESFDIAANGNPINAHPLSGQEMQELAALLETQTKPTGDYLQPQGMIPENLIHLNIGTKTVIWYTPPQRKFLHFEKQLDIPGREYPIPGMVWKASDSTLKVYAVKGKRKPALTTSLYKAPFFNIHDDNSVCMGTVMLDFKNCNSVESFIKNWETYFFSSYFSHDLGETFKKNLIQTYRELADTGAPFPKNAMRSANKTLQDII